MKKIVLMVLGLILVSHSIADIVVPRDTVTNFVNIRAADDSASVPVGQLAPGDHVPYSHSVSGWHVVEMPDGSDGFVSKRWTEVVPDPIDLSDEIVLHFLDVGTGDSTIIDMGNREIIIDGGDSIKVLNRYARDNDLIQDPIELVVVTHGDTDHWKGITRLVGFDGTEDDPFTVSEYWDPGYDRDCNQPTQGGRVNYLKFVENMEGMVPTASFLRPLADFHPPASTGTTPQEVLLSLLPGVAITVLHTDEDPTQGSCSYKINNASIVLLIEIEGFRFLFTGDANGKERAELPPGTPGHVEAQLLALESAHPGLIRADVLKVSHHGSETANTQNFIDTVNPDFAVISASTKHHLPKSSVVDRYDNGSRVILRTDDNHRNDTDHILCVISAASDSANELDCNFADVFNQ